MSTENKLRAIINTKTAIKNAIEEKGVTVNDAKFSEYPTKIQEISSGGDFGEFSASYKPGLTNYFTVSGNITINTEALLPEQITLTPQWNYQQIPEKPMNIGISFTGLGNGIKAVLLDGSVSDTIDNIKTFALFIGNQYQLTEFNLPNLEYAIFENGRTQDIPTGLFNNCKNLKFISFPNGTYTTINNCFDGCSKLENISIPNNVVNISLSSDAPIRSLTIPEGCTIENINSSTLQSYVPSSTGTIPTGYSALEYYYIPSSATTINTMAFSGCISLNHVVIPETVTNINANAFLGCAALKEVEMKSMTPPTLATGGIPNNEGLVITVPNGALSTYQNAPNWSSYTIKERM